MAKLVSSSVRNSLRSKIRTLGNAGLHAIYPKEFEHYFLALELVDYRQRTIDYFSFPILPSSIKEEHTEITNIRKTAGGVATIKNSTFVPKRISIKGNFGKGLKVLLGTNKVTLFGIKFSVNSGTFKLDGNPLVNFEKVSTFSSFAKTGYGCVKILEAMKDKSKQLVGGKPVSLYLYNPILGNNYLVEFKNFTHEQDEHNFNMIPNYTMELTATASLESLNDFDQFSNIKNLGIGVLQKGVNNVVNKIRRSIGG